MAGGSCCNLCVRSYDSAEALDEFFDVDILWTLWRRPWARLLGGGRQQPQLDQGVVVCVCVCCWQVRRRKVTGRLVAS